jgi:outer membrane protein OmpA-like peptidoglycan-associated protein
VLKEIQITQANTPFNFNVTCNATYKIIAEKEGFIATETLLNTTTILNEKLTKNLLLKPVECIQIISGIALNQLDNSELSNVKVSLFENNVLKEIQITQANTPFNFNVTCNATYKIIAEKEGFIATETLLNTTSILNEKITKNLLLKPVECNSFIAAKFVDKQTGLAIQNVTIQLFKNNQLIDNFNLENLASFEQKFSCNQEFSVIATKKGYKPSTTYFKTSAKNNEKTVKEILLEPIEEFISINSEKLIKTDVIYFDLDSDEIREDAAIEINKVIGVLIKYPSIKIEVASHTDSRAPDNYNLILSEKRAQSTINYMISNGIDPNRLVGKGYGETKLINKCANGVPCSNTEHELNRRTEFKIIEE